MSKQINVSAWLTLRQSSGVISIAGVRQNKPTLAPNETAVKIKLAVPDNIVFSAPTLTATVSEDDLAKPDIQAMVEPPEVQKT